MSPNQNPEQLARDRIDTLLDASGWIVQDLKKINLAAGLGVAVREYQTDVGPADYVLFVDGKPCGLIEAKRQEEGVRLTVVEEQSKDYAFAELKYLKGAQLRFVYESTGEITRFTDLIDPKPRSREVFTFHRPEHFQYLLRRDKTLRDSFDNFPALVTEGLRECQVNAITDLEKSFRAFKPKALIQMATGSGKTFTAITFIYRLLKYANAKRILFLVDTKNLGEQAEQEFQAYFTNDDNRKFTELYNVQLLRSDFVANDSQVCISTIQRMYSILKEEPLEESAEENNPSEHDWKNREQVPVGYNPKIPIEQFDFVVIDECHRSIYNLWKQVLDYFDAFQVGLTATPDNRTFGYFNQNVVSEYGYEDAVTDGVLVPYNIFLIETEVSKKGGVIWKGEYVDKRERLSRSKRWEEMDEDVTYTAKRLDDDVVNPNQIRTIIKTFKDHLPEMFERRKEVPKTLIFAKSDSHADDIVQIVREEFGESNDFCRKITYSTDNPKSTLQNFRNEFSPRIAVTVDMIATGTDVKPLECLLFMRDVKSRNYFEQMKGRGTRTIPLDDLKKVTPSATYSKDHFVIVDAIGVTKSLKTDSRPLERKPGVPLKDLLNAIAVGARDEDLFTSLANRLARLDKQLNEKEKMQFAEKAQGKTITDVVKGLLGAYNPDKLDELRVNVENKFRGESPDKKNAAFETLQQQLQNETAKIFTGELNTFIENVRRVHEQIIDRVNPDKVEFAGWNTEAKAQAEELVKDFKLWIEAHKDEITALQIFYGQPFRRRELTFAMVQELFDAIKLNKPTLAPLRVWQAYELLEGIKETPRNELVALVSLVRRITGIDSALTPYDKTVDRNFRDWILKKNAGQHNRFTEEQMEWLRMVKEHIATSFHLDTDDLDYTPFDAHGGRGRMWALFGEEMENIIGEMNEVLIA